MCIHHQNTIFLINAIRWNKSFKNFMALIACLFNADCMLHQCDQCLGIQALKSCLVQKFIENELEEDTSGEIGFLSFPGNDRILCSCLTFTEF